MHRHSYIENKYYFFPIYIFKDAEQQWSNLSVNVRKKQRNKHGKEHTSKTHKSNNQMLYRYKVVSEFLHTLNVAITLGKIKNKKNQIYKWIESCVRIQLMPWRLWSERCDINITSSHDHYTFKDKWGIELHFPCEFPFKWKC